MPFLVEPVGRAWFQYWGQTNIGGPKKKAVVFERKQEQTTNEYVIADDVDFDDCYSLLGIDPALGWNFSPEDIKKAYKKISLSYHPDKIESKTEDEAKYNENRYKAIQKAFDTLKEKDRKLLYDSKVEFDESIPGSDVDEEDIYEVFGEAFERYARFSVKPNPPKVGNDNTSREDLEKFYDFWHKFQSWRDFSYLGEFDVEMADNREEKRWMQKQNQGIARKKKKEELARIRKLVNRMEAHDPRMVRIRKRAAIERKLQQAAREKELEKIRKQKEAERKEEERKKEEKKQAERKEKQRKEREIARKVRALNNGREKIRAMLVKPPFPKMEKLDMDELDRLVGVARIEEVQKLIETMTPLHKAGSVEEKSLVKPFRSIYKKIRKRVRELEKKVREEEEARKRKNVVQSSGKPWTDEELKLLTGGIRRYPGGTVDRWAKIAKFLGTNRVEKEIISKVKDMAKMGRRRKESSKNAASKARACGSSSEKSWSSEQQKALETALKGTKNIKGPERWDAIAKIVPGHDKQSCIDRFNAIKAQILAKRRQMAKTK